MRPRKVRISARWVLHLALALVCAAAMPSAESYGATPKAKQTATQKKKGKKGGKPKPEKRKPETSADLRKQQQAAQKEVKLTKEQIAANDKEVSRGLSELTAIGADIDRGRAKVADAGRRLDEIDRRINGLETEIEAAQRDLERLRSRYLQAVRKLHAHRRDQSALAFVFSSSSFGEAMRRVRYLRQFSDWRTAQSGRIDAKLQELDRAKSQLASARTSQQKAYAAQQSAQRELQAQYARKDALVADLRNRGAALRQHLQRKQSEVNALNSRVAALIAEETRRAEQAERQARAERERTERERTERERAEREAREAEAAQRTKETEPKKAQTRKAETKKTETKKTEPQKSKSKSKKVETKKAETKTAAPSETHKVEKTPETKAPVSKGTGSGSSNFAALRGQLPRPVSGAFRVTGRFGRNSYPDMPDVVYDNPGIDAEVSKGVSVKAVHSGKVSGVYMVPGYGTVVIVNHGGYYTVYGNLASASVSVGTSVNTGTALGTAGASEDNPALGALHFEVWQGREKLNPEQWLR